MRLGACSPHYRIAGTSGSVIWWRKVLSFNASASPSRTSRRSEFVVPIRHRLQDPRLGAQPLRSSRTPFLSPASQLSD